MQHPSAAAAVYVAFDVGSRDERDGEHGLAHFLEHMVFKGTPLRPVGQAAIEIEAMGGDLNAWTSTDHTAFHATVSGHRWCDALDVLVDMTTASTLAPEDFAREKDVIVEEIHSYDDDPDSVLSDHVQMALWGEHPYGRRILGSEDSVRAQTVASMREFLHREYTTHRTVVVVVGPAEHGVVVNAVEARLSSLTIEPTAPRASQEVASQPAQQVVQVPGDFASTGAELAWSVPGVGHADLAALEVAAHILGQGAGALLTEALQRREHLAFGTWASLDLAPEGSSFTIGYIPKEGQTITALDHTLRAVESLARGCSASVCARSRTSLLADEMFLEETVDGIASHLLWHELTSPHPDAAQAYHDALTRVTPACVSRAVRRWLRRDRVVVGVLDTSVDRGALRRVLQQAKPTVRAGNAVETFTHASGVRIALKTEDSPIVALRVTALGGDRRLHERRAGIGSAWSQAALAGAGPRDAQAFGERLDDLAAQADGTCGRHTLSLGMTAPATEAENLLSLAGDVIVDPHFGDEDFAEIRDEMLEELRTKHDRGDQLANEALRALRWRGHPWRLPSGGTEASVKRLTTRALQRWHDLHFRAPNTVLTVVGGIDRQRLERSLTWLDDLDTEPAPPVTSPPVHPALGTVRHLQGGHEQGVVRLASAVAPLGHAHQRALELAVAILDGQGGRLFLSLREEAALAYDVWARLGLGVEGSTLTLGMGCHPTRVDEAATALQDALYQLADTPPQPDELERARSMLIGRRGLESQRTSHRASLLTSQLLFGSPAPLDVYQAELATTTGHDVSRILGHYLSAGLIDIRVTP